MFVLNQDMLTGEDGRRHGTRMDLSKHTWNEAQNPQNGRRV